MKVQSQGVIFFKNFGENETDKLGQNRDNLNHGNYDFDHTTAFKTQFKKNNFALGYLGETAA